MPRRTVERNQTPGRKETPTARDLSLKTSGAYLGQTRKRKKERKKGAEEEEDEEERRATERETTERPVCGCAFLSSVFPDFFFFSSLSAFLSLTTKARRGLERTYARTRRGNLKRGRLLEKQKPGRAVGHSVNKSEEDRKRWEICTRTRCLFFFFFFFSLSGVWVTAKTPLFEKLVAERRRKEAEIRERIFSTRFLFGSLHFLSKSPTARHALSSSSSSSGFWS